LVTGLRPEHAKRVRARLVLVAVVLAVILTVAVGSVGRYLRVDEIQLPDLRGMQFSEAVSLLREKGLVPLSYPENVPGATIEAVTSQTPAAGAVVRRGRTVAIGVHRPPETARAPILLGLTSEQAIDTAAAVNLALDTVEYSFSSQPVGRVIDQRPEPGARVDPEEGLSITVSRGPEQVRVTMPDVVGMRVDRARRRLAELGFRSIESLATGVSFESPGAVSAQQPAAGERVVQTTPVSLSYDLSARQVVPVPAVTGQNASTAGRLLRAAGLTVGRVRYVEDPQLPRGAVVEAIPSGFTLRGTPVVLTVNAVAGTFDELRAGGGENERFDPPGLDGGVAGGPRPGDRSGEELPASGRRVTVTFDPASLGVRTLLERDYDLRLVVQDDDGERTVVDRRVRAGEPVSAVVVVQGEALLQTYINGVFFQAWRP
jgi:beta-lactam-binding protein with PASTA domain